MTPIMVMVLTRSIQDYHSKRKFAHNMLILWNQICHTIYKSNRYSVWQIKRVIKLRLSTYQVVRREKLHVSDMQCSRMGYCSSS